MERISVDGVLVLVFSLVSHFVITFCRLADPIIIACNNAIKNATLSFLLKSDVDAGISSQFSSEVT